MPLSELEAQAHRTDMRVRAVLLELLGHKKEAQRELTRDGLPVLEEERLNSYVAEIDSQIAQYKMSGFF